jgi:NADH-quinone oxidoreductase subunit G
MDEASRIVSGLKGTGRLAVVLTPWLTNEDAWLLSKLFVKNGPLSGAKLFLGGRGPGTEDTILRKADKNPNRKGVETILSALGLHAAPLADLHANGFDAVVITGDKHDGDTWLTEVSRIPNRIVMGSFKSVLWDIATVFLPARVTTEKDGSFTNFDGVVQRLRRATTAAPTVKSEGWYAMKLAQSLGLALDFGTPRAIFAALANEVGAFSGMDYEALGEHGLRFGEVAPKALPEPVEEKTTLMMSAVTV